MVDETKRAHKKPIIIPGAKDMTEDELRKAKANERMRRYNARRREKKELEELHEYKKAKAVRIEEYKPRVVSLTGQQLRELDNKGMVELSASTRNNILQVLEMKVSQLYEDPDELKKVNLATLATAFGIMFDKNQLMNGLATENIAIQAKIDINMTSDMALAELNKMREEYAERNG